MKYVKIENGGMVDLAQIPNLFEEEFQKEIVEGCAGGMSVAAYFGMPLGGQNITLVCVLRAHNPSALYVGKMEVKGGEFQSLATQVAEVQLFEREIFEQYGIKPKSHPWLKPVRFEKSRECSCGRRVGEAPALEDAYQMEDESSHEVAVGPVHAGVIEPGHFRFQCSGEEVHHLEISLGYQHRGIERRMATAGEKAIHYAETLSGDTTIAHTLAHCRTREALAKIKPRRRAEAIRAVALELERIANHVGDLGALAGDVAFLPTASYCGRIRGEYLNMTAAICGNRFGRNLVREGGVLQDIGEETAQKILDWLDRVYPDTLSALNLMFEAPSVLDRFENTGTVSHQDALAIGLVGMVGRACGVRRDARHDLPTGYYEEEKVHVSVANGGDVLARAKVRFMEIEESVRIVRKILSKLVESAETGRRRGDECRLIENGGQLRFTPNAFAIDLEEAWRGEVCHIAVTNEKGEITFCKIIDPSFHNWFGLALALRNQAISDFPICNKSFNLSYCGHDL